MGKVLKIAASAAMLVAGVATGNPMLILAGVSTGASALRKKPAAANRASQDRLYASIVPGAHRKQVFGETAMATDVRYQAFTGADKEYYHQIVCVASHKVHSIDELWLDDKQAWTASGGVQAGFTGYLTVTAVLEGSAANAVTIDSVWSAAAGCYLTGCAYLHLRFKLTGNSKKTESPFAQSVPNRMTIRGKGRLFYDPRRDSTRGGSGAMRADDQATWAWSPGGTAIGRNAALAELNNLLGWRINGKLAVGRGVPPERIDFDSFITAANICDEARALAAGGTEPRYRFDGIISEDEEGGAARANIEAAMAGNLRDAGGKLACRILVDDLSAPVMTFSDADVIGAVQWKQTQGLDTYRNIMRGRFVDPSDNALYQMIDYPQVSLAAPDGIDRIQPFDLPGVQSAAQAQCLAKQALQRLQFDGVLTLPVNAKGWAAKVDDPVAVSLAQYGWTDMPFRVTGRPMRYDGVCELTLALEDPAIYAWAAEESPAVVPAGPISYDWTKHPWQQANIEDDADVTLLISGPAKSSVACDFTGAAKAGQLPKTLTFALLRGAAETDETANATWSCAVTSGSGAVANGAAPGKVALSAIGSDRIEITVEAVLNGTTRSFVHVVEKLIDATPVSGGGGGGSSASDTSINNTTSASYGSANAGILTVTAQAGGIVDLSFPGSFIRTTSGIGNAAGKWQWRVVGGVFADVAAEIASSVDSFTNTPDGTYDPGSIFVTQQKTGLTPGTAYEFQLLLRNGGGYTQNWTGTASAVAS
jgi:hypothetical protein